MTYLEMMQHYTSIFSKNTLKRVIAKWEEYKTVTEWGYQWEGGYLVENIYGDRFHVYGWKMADAPWMDQAWVYTQKYDIDSKEYSMLLLEYDWKLYSVKVNR